MRVLQINTVCNGSTGHIACDLAYEVIKNGDECVVAFGRGNPPKNIPYIKIGNKFSNYFHVFLTRVFDAHGVGSYFATKKLIKQIEKYNPDVIHLHNIHGYYINVKLLFKYLKQSGKKVVWTLHDCWPFTGHCVYVDAEGCQQWRSNCKKCSAKQQYPRSVCSFSQRNYKYKKLLFTSLEKDQLTIVTPSKWLANIVQQSYLSKYKTIVINNSINTEIFKPTSSSLKQKYNLENKKVLLGVASNWEERKGLGDFIELSRRIPEQYKIVLIGLNQQQINSLPTNILGIRRTESMEQLAQWYSCSYAFLNLTYQDNYPTVNLEASACGTSVITYNTGGSVESADYIVNHKDYNKIIEILNQGNLTKGKTQLNTSFYQDVIKLYK